jgi:hypothetical protein
MWRLWYKAAPPSLGFRARGVPGAGGLSGAARTMWSAAYLATSFPPWPSKTAKKPVVGTSSRSRATACASSCSAAGGALNPDSVARTRRCQAALTEGELRRDAGGAGGAALNTPFRRDQIAQALRIKRYVLIPKSRPIPPCKAMQSQV